MHKHHLHIVPGHNSTLPIFCRQLNRRVVRCRQHYLYYLIQGKTPQHATATAAVLAFKNLHRLLCLLRHAGRYIVVLTPNRQLLALLLMRQRPMAQARHRHDLSPVASIEIRLRNLYIKHKLLVSQCQVRVRRLQGDRRPGTLLSAIVKEAEFIKGHDARGQSGPASASWI